MATMPKRIKRLLALTSQALLLAFTLTFIEGKVVKDFSKCTRFFYKEMVPEFGKKFVHICQRYENTYYYATLYNKVKRIAVYSAYIFEPNASGEREKYWFVEPQLVRHTLTDNMKYEGDLLHELRRTDPDIYLGEKQALDEDYKNSGFDRGHLNPCLHHGGDSRKSTNTLTNVVPQDHTLNNGAWNRYELQISTMFKQKNCSQAYVLVGAIPSSNNWIVKKNVRRVNIPEFIWNAYCCVDQSNKPILSGAAIAKNTNESMVKQQTVGKMVKFLKKHSILEGTELFSGQCKA